MGEVDGVRGPTRESSEPNSRRTLHFADIELDLAKAELRRAGARRSISALSLALLEYLIRERARVVSRDELLAEVWRGVTVSEGSLRQAISELRQVLDDTGDQQRLIRTVRGRGYRFVGTLHAEPEQRVFPIVKAAAPPRICFGRVAELERAGTLLDEANAGAGRSCVLFGPPGIGKSCLARELVQVARSRQLTSVEGYADPDGVAPAFWPWLQLLTGYFELCDAASRARYEALSPAAFRLLHGARGGGYPERSLDAATAPDRFELLEELGRLFVALATELPGLLLLEDLQWADQSSLALLGHVARLLPRTRSLLLLTCRELPARENRPLARALDAVKRSGVGELLVLGNLSLDDVSRIIEAHVPSGAPRSLSVEVHELSGGNPLFALELARLLARPGHGQRLVQERPELQLVIHRRLLGLPERAQPVLQAAAVLSPVFPLAELAGVLQELPQVALERLDICIEQGVMVEAEEAGRFEFAHPLLREAAYATLSRAQRARLHQLAGEWLERHAQHSGALRSNELAHHFFIAAANQDAAGKAVYYARRCAELACRSAAYADALSHYDRALICADLDPASEPRDKLELALLRAEAWRETCTDTTRVNQHFLALSEQASALGDAQLFARAVLGYLGQRGARYTPTRFLASTDPRDAVLLQRALERLGDEPSEARVLVLCSLVYTLMHSTDRARRERLAADALEQARTLSTPWLLARALSTTVYCCTAPDAISLRLTALDELVELTRQHAMRAEEVDALVTRAVCLLGIGERSRAQRDEQRARDLAKKLDLASVTLRSEVPALLRAFLEGQLDEAERLSRRALDLAKHDLVERALFMVRMSTLLMLRGGPRNEMVASFEDVHALYPEVIGMRCLLAYMYAQLGDPENARRHFDPVAWSDFRSLPEDYNWLTEMTLLAGAAVFLGDAERAALVYERLVPHAHRFDFISGQGSPGGPVAFWLGELALVIGDHAAAARWYDAADAVNARVGARLFDQCTAVGRAKLLLLGRGPEQARAMSLLAGAVAFAHRSGVDWLRILADDLIQRQPARALHSESAAQPLASEGKRC